MEMEAEKMDNRIEMQSVKELVAKKEGINRIPERYIHNDRDIEAEAFASSSLPEVPVIDLAKLSSSCDSSDHELQKLHLASKHWGFFQVINHGVRLELLENVKKGAEEMFNLSMEEKQKLWRKPGDMEGFGQMFDVPQDEQHKSDWVDVFYVFTLPSYLRKPHLFPNIPLPFRENLEEYSVKLREVAMKILDVMAQALRMEPNEMKDIFKEGGQSVKMNCFPPCPQPHNVIGIDAHTDGTALTILHQVNDVQGLQIKKDGMWIPVNPLPNAFVVNIGDVLQIITNGTYPSVEHRATVNSEKERISIATFYGPGHDGFIGPAPSLLGPERPALFRTLSVADYYKGFVSKEGTKKSYIDVMRIQNQDSKILS